MSNADAVDSNHAPFALRVGSFLHSITSKCAIFGEFFAFFLFMHAVSLAFSLLHDDHMIMSISFDECIYESTITFSDICRELCDRVLQGCQVCKYFPLHVRACIGLPLNRHLAQSLWRNPLCCCILILQLSVVELMLMRVRLGSGTLLAGGPSSCTQLFSKVVALKRMPFVPYIARGGGGGKTV